MNEDVIADLKQFIATTVKQETAAIRSEIRGDLQSLEQRLTTRIDNLEQSIAESLDASNEATDGQLKDHERRIGLLEQKAAA